jgi:hypothetical protein
LIDIEKYWGIIIRGRILKKSKRKHMKNIEKYWKNNENILKIMKNIEKIMKNIEKYWRVSILINIKCIEGSSPNSTKITYFLNVLSSDFSEGLRREFIFRIGIKISKTKIQIIISVNEHDFVKDRSRGLNLMYSISFLFSKKGL